MPVKPVANKKISLKKNNEENEAKKRQKTPKSGIIEDNNVTEDGISLNVDDTLDMFEEDSSLGNGNKNRKQAKGNIFTKNP